MRLEGKIAIVTGAASGFGEGIAKKFVAEGAKVVVADRDGDGAARAAAKLGESALGVRADVTQAADVKAMVEAAVARFGGLDIVVNNAGMGHVPQPLDELDEATFDRILALNVKSIYLAAREVVLKVLSGVARGKGRFGKVAIAQMLNGLAASKLERLGLTRLSTFGIMSDFGKPEVTALIDALTTAGLVVSKDVDRFRPVVDISEPGREYLKAKGDVPLELPLSEELYARVRGGGLDRPAPKPSSTKAAHQAIPVLEAGRSPGVEEEAPASDLSGDPLYHKLKLMRANWAREANQSAYTIFPNKTLDALVRERPKSPHELAAIKGVGPVIRERYGSKILEAIAGTTRPSVAPGPTGPSPGPSKAVARPEPRPAHPPSIATPSTSYVPTEEWTWRLLDRGFDLVEAAEIRGLELSTIFRHATLMARKGSKVEIERYLTPELIDAWEAHRRSGEATPPAGWEEWAGLFALFLACRGANP